MDYHIPNGVKFLILCLVLLFGSSVKKCEVLCPPSAIYSPFSPSFSNTKRTHCMLGLMRIISSTVAIFEASIPSYFCAGLRKYDKIDGN